MRKIILFVLALAVVAAVWEIYKSLGPETGGKVLGWRVLPRTSDNAMPHVWTMTGRLFDPESRTSETPLWVVGVGSAWYWVRLALRGFAMWAVACLTRSHIHSPPSGLSRNTSCASSVQENAPSVRTFSASVSSSTSGSSR